MNYVAKDGQETNTEKSDFNCIKKYKRVWRPRSHMKSIFNQDGGNVTVDGTAHHIEADVTHGGSQVFRITNEDTGTETYVTRNGAEAKLGMRGRPLPETVRKALEKHSEITISE
jgi:hypothetical protein